MPTIVLVVLAAHSPAGSQGIQVALQPALIIASPRTEFELEMQVSAGAPFNGFAATISYDPVALMLLPMSPTALQQGCMMTGDCSAACGNTFHLFSAAGDSAAITDVLLCNQISLTGPGTIYKLRFRAATKPRPTTVRIRSAAFYNGGFGVTPVTTADAQVWFNPFVGVGENPQPGTGIRLHAEPNPAHGAITFSLDADAAGDQRLEIHDVTGRRVRRVDGGWRPAGSRQVTWDGRDAAGAPVPAGVYIATLGDGRRTTRVRVAVIR